jgi:hypothetical protein
MITDPAELSELTKTTEDLIEEDSIDIDLQRTEDVRTPSGGVKKGQPIDVPVQRLHFAAVMTDPRNAISEHGDRMVAGHVLVGMPDADIKEGDTFAFGTRKFRVNEVHPDRSFETRAWVVEDI